MIYIRIIWKEIKWNIVTTKGSAPFITCIFRLNKCAECSENIPVGNKCYINNNYEEILDIKEEEQQMKLNLLHTDMITIPSDTTILCEQCFMLSAVRQLKDNKSARVITHRAVTMNEIMFDELIASIEEMKVMSHD